MSDIRRIVEDQIKHNQELAQTIALSYERSQDPRLHKDIVHFFPELSDVPGHRWSNFPRNVPLSAHLLLGPTPVFDLIPMTAPRFAEEYGLSIAHVGRLADRRLILPSLYVRDPSEWKGGDDMKELIKKSFVNGERVDVYLSSLNLGYEPEKLYGSLERALNTRSRNSLESLAAQTGIRTPDEITDEALRETLIKVISKRWAYLRVFADSKIPELFQEMVEIGDIDNAAKDIRFAKHIFGSRTTASLGGDFIWDPNQKAEFEQRLSERSGREIPWEEPELASTLPDWFFDRYLGVHEAHLKYPLDPDAVVATIENEEYISIKSHIEELKDKISSKVAGGEIDTNVINNLDNLGRLYKEQLNTLVSQNLAKAELTVSNQQSLSLVPINWVLRIAYGTKLRMLHETANKVWSYINRDIPKDYHKIYSTVTDIQRRSRKQ